MGDNSELVPLGAAANWDCVDETPSDGNTTYVRSANDNEAEFLDLYNIFNTAIPAGSTINSVTVKVNIRSSNATYLAEFRITLKKSGGATQYSAVIQPPTTYTVYSQVFAGVGLADLNALQIGIAIASGAFTLVYPGLCTQVWVEIDYTLAGVAKQILMNGFVLIT